MAQRFNAVTGQMEEVDDVTGMPATTPAAVAPVAPTPVAPAPAEDVMVPVQINQPGIKTTRKVQSPEEIELLKQRQGLEKEGFELQKRQNEIDKMKAQDALDRAKEDAARQIEKQKTVDTALAQGQADIARRTAEYDARYNDYKNMKFKDFWEDKSTGTKIAAALAIGLGAIGQAMAKTGSNTAFEIINKAIDRDFEKQRQEILKGKETVGLAKEGIEVARQNKTDLLNDINIKEVAAKDQVAAKYEQILRERGVPEQAIQGDANLLKLRDSANNAKLKVEESLRSTVEHETASKILKPAGAVAAEKAASANKEVDALRKEFADLPEAKSYKIVANSYEKIKTASGKAGDLGLVYGYIKMLDPGSTVRESESSMASNIGGMPEKAQNYVQYLLGNGSLTEKQREEIRREAQGMMAAEKVNIRPTIKEYERIAKERGMNPNDVIILRQMETDEQEKATADEVQRAEAAAAGRPIKDDEKKKSWRDY